MLMIKGRRVYLEAIRSYGTSQCYYHVQWQKLVEIFTLNPHRQEHWQFRIVQESMFGLPHFLYHILFQELHLAPFNSLEIHGLNRIGFFFSVSHKISLEIGFPGLVWQHHSIMRVLSLFLLCFLSLFMIFILRLSQNPKQWLKFKLSCIHFRQEPGGSGKDNWKENGYWIYF